MEGCAPSSEKEKPPTLRRLRLGDVPAVSDIALRSPGAARWAPSDYERAASGECDGWVAEKNRRVVGFVIARRLADEMEILNLGVEPAARRRGTATRLLEAALKFGLKRRAKKAFLEVRASNTGAIAFYQRMSFGLEGRRPGYYTDPTEDALVLSRQLVSDSF